MPSLQDPNFVRSVIALAAHSEEGAFGLVINRPLEITLAEICAEADIPWLGSENARALAGGPVEPHRGWILHSSEHSFDATQVIGGGISVSTSNDALAAYGRDPDGRFRLVLGYAGWGQGQLDREIAEGAWLTAPLSDEIVFDTPQEAIWRTAMASVGVDPTYLIDAGSHLN